MIHGRRLRLVIVMTHPVQYLAPWFRYIHQHAPELDLTVVYATEPTPEQQAVGFGAGFQWDVPLRDGYRSIVLRPMAPGVSVSSGDFWGLDVSTIGREILSLRPDVAVIPGWHSATQVRAVFAMRRAGIPVLYRGDSHLESMSPRWRMLSRLRARFLLKQFDGYLAVGVRAQQYLRAHGVPDPAIVRSPHAVDNDAFRDRARIARNHAAQFRARHGIAADANLLLFVGKLKAWKRPADVLDAAARAGHGTSVLFVGDGEQRGSLMTRARELGVPTACAGFLNQQEVSEAYAAADVLVLPSDGNETWGLVVNEALASGLPAVVSSRVGCAPDLDTPGVCEVAEFGNPDALVQAINRLQNSSHRDAVTECCWNVVQRHSFEAATEGLIAGTRMVVRNRRRVSSSTAIRVVALAGNMVVPGGMERMTVEALSALRRGGADVHVLLNSWSSRAIATLAERANLSWEVGHYDAPLDGVFRRPLRMARALCDVAWASTHLLRLVVRRQLTHVFAPEFRAILTHAPALVICRFAGVPVILRSGVAPTRTALHSLLWRLVILPLVSRHVANSAFTASELRGVGVRDADLLIVTNVAPTRPSSASVLERHARRIAYVGQLIPGKGVLELLDAIAILVARERDVHLVIAGEVDGWAPEPVIAYRAGLKARATRSDLDGRVAFLGWREDADRVLQGAALHCCPSQPEIREAFGIVVAEAKRAGTPSVVCPSGALPELIRHGEDGWITEGFDAAAIADGLDWFLSDETRLARAQRAARDSSTRFDPAVFDRLWQKEFGLREAEGTLTLAPRMAADVIDSPAVLPRP